MIHVEIVERNFVYWSQSVLHLQKVYIEAGIGRVRGRIFWPE